MNILAHGWLSGRNDSLLAGNFLGDFVKGAPDHPRHELTPGEVAGVRLHRAIDSFTDDHDEVAAVRDLLRPRCHKYAGPAVDIFFDHFLAANFTELTGESLASFTQYYYGTLQRNSTHFPDPAMQMLGALVQYDWIRHYPTIDGIDRSLKGVSRRTAFPSGLDTAVIDLERYYAEISQSFSRFWPALVAEVERVRLELGR
ncbi:ACP phosphodiesterase [Spirosoma utsteinense]|uniref:Acyl carrier protein phosphodiesterase n=1 Tax=Spirosoma utsteinense TaxID=2585773 RepID=A0ABR6W0H8_9BACT|nr:ACP phosphodiesterase [Spirosoma utsteinense]MBC3784650.1 acyl carrier protein phosphodiesterase [Spirosoma utsteinense]MBC3789596.1 acyl carrier protein phosphodiesterase [Spirosoma utsteinense]